MRRTFQQFVEDDSDFLRSEWVLAKYPTGTLKIYVRRCIRWRGAFELANLEMSSERQMGKGTFTAFLAEWNDQLPLMVEWVHNPRLAKYLARNGWGFHDKNGTEFYYNDNLKAMMAN